MVGGIVSSLLSCRYVDYAADHSVDVASRSCHSGPHIHGRDNIKQFYENTAASLKPLSRISSVPRVSSAAKRKLLSASEVLNIKVRSAPTAWAPGPPVLACQSAAGTMAARAVNMMPAVGQTMQFSENYLNDGHLPPEMPRINGRDSLNFVSQPSLTVSFKVTDATGRTTT